MHLNFNCIKRSDKLYTYHRTEIIIDVYIHVAGFSHSQARKFPVCKAQLPYKQNICWGIKFGSLVVVSRTSKLMASQRDTAISEVHKCSINH